MATRIPSRSRLKSRGALLREALEAAGEIPNDWLRSRALRKLAPLLPGELLGEALEMARAPYDPGARARALNDLAVHLPEEERAKALQEALAAARSIPEAAARGAALVAAASQMEGQAAEFTAREGLQALRNTSDLNERSLYLRQLPDFLLDEALAEARLFPPGWQQASAMAALAGRYTVEDNHPVISEALSLVQDLGDTSTRALLLGELASAAGPGLAPDLARQAMEAALESREEGILANLVELLSGLLGAEHLEQAALAARGMQDRSLRAAAQAALAPYIQPENRQEAVAEAFADVKSLTDDWSCAAVLYPLADLLSDAQMEEALALVHGFRDDWARAEALGDLSEHFPDPRKEQILGWALSSARRAPSAWSRAQALASVASHL
jgi:hypothetical protein